MGNTTNIVDARRATTAIRVDALRRVSKASPNSRPTAAATDAVRVPDEGDANERHRQVRQADRASPPRGFGCRREVAGHRNAQRDREAVPVRIGVAGAEALVVRIEGMGTEIVGEGSSDRDVRAEHVCLERHEDLRPGPVEVPELLTSPHDSEQARRGGAQPRVLLDSGRGKDVLAVPGGHEALQDPLCPVIAINATQSTVTTMPMTVATVPIPDCRAPSQGIVKIRTSDSA
jgi:hypothetical protein